jgi:dihydrodipicolinate synthase/N-acetylneuraminate lyase
VLVGPEELTAEAVLLGGHGGINGGANLHPKLYVQMYQAAAAQDLKRTRELHAKSCARRSIYTVGRHKAPSSKASNAASASSASAKTTWPSRSIASAMPSGEIIRERLSTLGLL